MKNLKIKGRCPRPFDTVTIDKNGNCYACECSGWLPEVIGNLKIQTLSEVLQSSKVKKIRSTIHDGTYAYCNENLCSWLQDTKGGRKNWWTIDLKPLLKEIRLGIDDSCNLSCPSCRIEKIFEKRGIKLKSRFRLADRVLEYIKSSDNTLQIHIGSDGDPFASLVYRYFINKCPKKSNLTFSIQTNGLLIKKMFARNQWMFKQLKRIGVSVDGCTTDTYEVLRKGGKFSLLLENLQFLKQLKQTHNFSLQFHCVVQKINVHQLFDYVKFAFDLGADEVFLNRIIDWKTLKNFSEQDVTDPTHPDHHTLKDQILKISTLPYQDKVSFPTLKL